VRVLQDAAGAVESGQERGPAPGALPPVQPLARGERDGPLAEMLGTEQFATDGSGEQVLAGAGTAGEQAGSEPARLERSDGADLE
jgi:hypothetical protein